MQTKLHRWALADHGFRFDDVFNFVCDPATLMMAFERVAGNAGARTAGVDGMRAADVETSGVTAHLDRIRSELRTGAFRPLPVRERMIPKPGGKLRRLGIPTITDRVVQAALKLVLEPIFEADFRPCSYGFRPNRRAHDAIAEIHLFGSQGYRWVLDVDIEACFDRIDHAALMDRVRARVKDKRVLALVKAFLKAGIMTELGERNETVSGTPQGGILSPLLANIALSVLDDFAAEHWATAMATRRDRERRRHRGLPTWRLVRYADDFVIMVHGTREHVEDLRGQVSEVLAPMGLVLSPAKTTVVHLADGFNFLGFRIVWMRKRGTDKWHVYTFIADKPVETLKRKIKTLTQRLSHLDYKIALIRINQILRGWANYFKHAVAKHTMQRLHTFVWWRVIRWVMHRHRMTWRAIQRWLRTPQGRWKPIELGGIRLFDLGRVSITRYRYRGNAIPSPWPEALIGPTSTA
ncbi:group II intron reverse transcriptase/maturase [Nonomuraea turkmeniaca]|uniref:Group II intron reverse transcriptase/maturase n=1 Tax=Nonomuraea turkmeniaca TaxID=103838 RepID=A0A5S4EUE7_9ACTN|nr:group II intron reverse transcriptase/maturase [Nonomuraea turkmeniaca]TMR04347.1 group II intron reverse transcriptase/maturase [Nonomuraea turkmeniaca]